MISRSETAEMLRMESERKHMNVKDLPLPPTSGHTERYWCDHYGNLQSGEVVAAFKTTLLIKQGTREDVIQKEESQVFKTAIEAMESAFHDIHRSVREKLDTANKLSIAISEERKKLK